MPVEIQVLSGSRQGQRVYIDAPRFRVGDQPACEVFFDPSRDQAAQGRAALFRLHDDGWYVQSAGQCNVLINDQRLTGSMRIRSGDVVRMSDRGPDFSFNLVARSAATAVAATQPATIIGPCTVKDPADAMGGLSALADRDSDKQAATGTPNTCCAGIDHHAPGVPLRTESAVSTDVTLVESKSPGKPKIPLVPIGRLEPQIPSRWILAAAAMILLVAVGLLFWTMGRHEMRKSQSPASQATASAPVEQAPKSSEPPAPTKQPAQAEPSNSTVPPPVAPPRDQATPAIPEKPPASQPAIPAEPPPRPTDPWEAVSQRAKKGIVMLCVQDTRTNSVWVSAAGSAVSEKLILTTATAATELANDYREDYWKIWACQNPRGDKYPLKDIRVHVGYVKAADRQEKVYFDLALISVDQALPASLPLAPAKVLSELDRGYPLGCLGIPHEMEPIDRFQNLQPELVPARVFVISSLAPSPGAPRLLHVKASLLQDFRGSPLITPEGSVAAVYCTPAAAGDDKADTGLRLHYAVVVEPQLIDLWKQGRGRDAWVAPTSSASTPPARQPTP